MCFLLGLSPWTPLHDVDPDTVVALARRLLVANADGRWYVATTRDMTDTECRAFRQQGR